MVVGLLFPYISAHIVFSFGENLELDALIAFAAAIACSLTSLKLELLSKAFTMRLIWWAQQRVQIIYG